MAERERPERFELRVTDIEDPLPDATFGSIGRYVEVGFPERGDEPTEPRRLVLHFEEKQAEHVDPRTLTLFQVDLESGSFTPVETSRVDVDKLRVSAWVDHPGIYGLIGLPQHGAVLETLRLLDHFTPQLLEDRESGEHGLQDRICGLILCADPSRWGDGPMGPGDLCEKCLGLDVSFDRLPERYLWEGRPPIPPLREIVDDDDGAAAGTATILTWGSNQYGELGDGTTTPRTTPVWVVPRLNARKIVGAGDWTLALSTDGTVWAWGFDALGQLGDGLIGVTYRSTPGPVAFLTDVVDIAAGPNHGVAVRSDGTVWRWGLPSWSATGPIRLPQWFTALSGIVAVAAGEAFTLALRNDGRVFAWGANSSGQLGDGTLVDRSTPVQVSGLTGVRSIAAGLSSSFAIKSNGAVVAWGAADGWALGDGTTGRRVTPAPVPGLANVEQVATHGHGLARTTAGEVWTWGPGWFGESGDGSFVGHQTPVQVPGLHNVTGIAAGDLHCLAVRSDGTVWVWGSGPLGTGITAGQGSPDAVPLPAGRQAVGVGAGDSWSFAMLG